MTCHKNFVSEVVFCPGGQITALYAVPLYWILSTHAHRLNMHAEAARVRPVQTSSPFRDRRDYVAGKCFGYE